MEKRGRDSIRRQSQLMTDKFAPHPDMCHENARFAEVAENGRRDRRHMNRHRLSSCPLPITRVSSEMVFG